MVSVMACGAAGMFPWPGEAWAGLTGQRQRRFVPLGFFLKSRPPSFSVVSSVSFAAALCSFCSLSPVPALFPSCISHSVPLFISLRSCSSPGPLQTLSGELRVGGGRQRRRDEEIEQDKSAEMQLRGWLSKEAGRCLYAACERTDRADSLFYPRPSAEACLGQKQHIHPLVHLHQASLRWDVGTHVNGYEAQGTPLKCKLSCVEGWKSV